MIICLVEVSSTGAHWLNLNLQKCILPFWRQSCAALWELFWYMIIKPEFVKMFVIVPPQVHAYKKGRKAEVNRKIKLTFRCCCYVSIPVLFTFSALTLLQITCVCLISFKYFQIFKRFLQPENITFKTSNISLFFVRVSVSSLILEASILTPFFGNR